MLVKLSSGSIINEEAASTKQTDKKALLVYAGNFESMDGPVTITPAHLEILAKNHNEKLNKLGDLVKMGDYPPIQLDHSVSARDTVGRLVGPLELGTHQGVYALFGQIRMLGIENWEKVLDGRWTHLSIGADLEKGELQELTITPFPAAKNACFLSQKKGEQEMSKKKMSEETKEKEEKKDEDTKLSEEKSEEKNDEKKEDKKELSADKDADDTKLSEEKKEDEKSKEDKEEDKKEVEASKVRASAKAELSAALSSFQSQAASMRLALKSANIQARLSRLKAQAKVSPAELKKLDIAKLSASNDVTIEAVLKTYEDREPVIMAGQYGTVKATNASEIAKEVRLSTLEDETRENMALLKGKGKAKTRMSMPTETEDTKKKEEVSLTGANVDLWDEIVKAMREGQEETGKALFCKACKMSNGDVSVDEKQMASLMSAFSSLEENFGTVVRLASAQTAGVKL